jgi:sigma-E factor negative regulatory protein RseC
MENQAQVRRILDDGSAEVVLIRESACSGDCHKCTGCGAARQSMTVMAQNPIGAALGDWVILHSDSAPVLKGAAVLYILPLLLFFLGYALGAVWGMGALFGGLAFALAVAVVVIYDRRVSAKQKSVYTIIGYSQESAERKGDN